MGLRERFELLEFELGCARELLVVAERDDLDSQGVESEIMFLLDVINRRRRDELDELAIFHEWAIDKSFLRPFFKLLLFLLLVFHNIYNPDPPKNSRS